MPYTYKKVGDKYCVYKKEGGAKVGCTAGNANALKKYLAALHIHGENIKENSQEEKNAAINAAKSEIELLQVRINAATDELQKAREELKNATAMKIREFSLAKYVKGILEAEGDEDPAAGADTAPGEAPEEAPAEKPKEAPAKAARQDTLDVFFNMANVKKYNSYPVIDNTGTVVGVSKNGLAVKVGDNVIFVDFEDLLD